MNIINRQSAVDQQEEMIVSPTEIFEYRSALIRFLVNLENKRTTEELLMLKEVVAALTTTISALRDLGVTFSEIAGQLKTAGLEIDCDTLQDMYYDHCNQVTEEAMERKMCAWCDSMLSQAKKLVGIRNPCGGEESND